MNDNMKKVGVALRSGLYEQTVETLQDEIGFCCLGVMCMVYEKETGIKLERDRKGFIYGEDLSHQEGVREWAGLQHSDGESKDKSSLIQLNDEGHTFAAIADFIESEPEGLFS
jgi:hypothetical protein